MAAGRLIVIPMTNASGFASGDPQEASPAGVRALPRRPARAGSATAAAARASPTSGPTPTSTCITRRARRSSGNQTRNMNRAYPGRADGNFTERCAYAVTELVRREQVDLVIDLHEASPEYPVINTIVAHERAMPLAVAVAMNLELRGIKIGLEASPANLRGLSHRELGDHTPALARADGDAQRRRGPPARPAQPRADRDRPGQAVCPRRARRPSVRRLRRARPPARAGSAPCATSPASRRFLKAFTEENKARPVVAAAYPRRRRHPGRGARPLPQVGGPLQKRRSSAASVA